MTNKSVVVLTLGSLAFAFSILPVTTAEAETAELKAACENQGGKWYEEGMRCSFKRLGKKRKTSPLGGTSGGVGGGTPYCPRFYTYDPETGLCSYYGDYFNAPKTVAPTW